ncbi:hypothetical protein ACOMHN_059148 [Nucella lapillus]
MTYTLPFLAASLCLGLVPILGLPAASRPHLTPAHPPPHSLQPPAASSAAKSLTKRDISINQDLRSLANMLMTQEYNRIMSQRRNREFLRKIGKRGDSGFGAGEEGDGGMGNGREGDVGVGEDLEDGLMPQLWEMPAEDLWPEW